MHLKSLAIQGFKSFPERTVIEFHQGVTAIIGPNGSGKSNVTDAIRWVLGEQSVRTLRGSRMEDVIFTGTQSRRAMSFAEVSMTLDNSDGKLPLDYTEIQIARRLYRSGESEYLLNNTVCRLKDIATLFMDTGLGRDGYSIVGQGRVDDVLSHRSEDRRRIFEEASGIVKFKTRKEEAERKLQQTEQNILRVNDIIEELESRMEPLAEQAAAARQYLNWRDQLKSLDMAMMLDTLDQQHKQFQEAEKDKKLLLDDLDRADQDLLDLKNQNHETSRSLEELEKTISNLQQAISSLNQQVSELNGQIALTEEKKLQQQQRLQQASDEEEQLRQSLGDLKRELAQRQDRAAILEKQEQNYQAQLEAAESDMQAILATLGQAEQQIEQDKLKRDQLLEKIFESRNQLTETQGQIQLVESRRKTIAQEIMGLKSDRDRLQLLLEEKDACVQKLEQEKTRKEQELQANQERLDEASRILSEQQKKLENCQQDLENSRYRLKTLQDLERNFEGYGDTVRHLLKKADQDQDFARGLRGSLGSLIQVEQAYELAIEIALGPAIQNLVTDHEQTASRLISYLKESRAGRATFLPIATIRPRRLEQPLLDQASHHPQYIGLASDLVSCPQDIRPIIENLLGRVLVVEDLDAATRIARQLRHSCRIVTREGDVIHPGGSMTGGHQRRQASLLRRNREIGQLEEKIKTLASDKEACSSQVVQQREKHREAARILAGLEQKLLEISHDLIREESRQTAFLQEQERGVARQAMLQEEDRQLQLERQGIEAEIMAKKEQISKQENEVLSLRQGIESGEQANQSKKERRNELRETITDLKVSLNSIQESVQAAREMSERIGLEEKNQKQRLEKQAELQAESQKQISWLEREILALQVKADQLEQQGREVAEQLAEQTRRRELLESRQKGYFDQLEQAGSRLAGIQTEIGRCESRLSRIEIQMDEVKNRMWETYAQTVQQAESMRKPIGNRAEATREINLLRQSMRELGDVNLAAIEESSQVENRHQFMVRQRDDIETSRSQLNTVIDDLTEAMKKQFVEHFELINSNFNTVFSELFGGGMAEVNLEDQDDVLSCGIEIRAQPPGKRLQNLMLLSGGERCLTAIALLFAILKLRPTPFCVLDEVEAALDDANVSRFTEYIRSYAHDAQFILVTHRKGTMEAADRLYGVTMQERGISRILSMQLTD